MTRRLALLGLIAGVAYGANLAPPVETWKADGPADALFQKPANDAPAAGVRGKGEDSAAWRAVGLKLPPGGTYMLRFRTQAEGSGSVISGLDAVNRDFAASPAWTTFGFAFRTPDAGAPVLRLGQWHLKGEVLFQNVELYPVQVVHRRWGDLVLGDGERIENGVYTDTHLLAWRGSTIHRTLAKQSANFNSNRWCFGAGSEVIYKHALPLAMSGGEVRLNVNYHTAGTLVVSASKDGQNWTKLGEGTKVSSIEAKLPAELLPAKELSIRLQAEGKNANLQVDSYTFRGTVEKTAEPRVGGTVLLEERLLPADLRVAAEPAANAVRLRWSNAADAARSLELQLQREGSPAPASTTSAQIPAKGEAVADVPYPPLPAGVHTVTIAVVEKNIRVGELRCEVTCTVISESAYGHPLASALPDLGLWWCEAAWKVGLDRTVPAGDVSPAISLSAARGEFEAAQLVLNAKKAGLAITRAEAGDLTGDKGKIPASAIVIDEVATVNVENPSDYLGEPGEYPDPLPPLVTPLKLPAGRNQALWILVHVPDDAPAGLYRGTLRIATDAGEVNVPLQLNIYDFALPKDTHLRSGLGLDWGTVKRYHKLKTKEQEQEVYELYMKSFSEHRIAPYSFYDLAPIQVKVEGKGADKQVKIGWEAFDAAAQKYLDGLHFNAFQLPVQGLGGGTFYERAVGNFGGFKAGTPEYERLLGDYLKQLESHLKEKGWLKKAYIYWFDEPDTKDFPFVVEVMQRIKKLAPGLVRLMTKHPDGILAGNVDLWCGLTPEWTPQKVAERRAAGEEVWWYICCGPKAPYIGEFTEHPGVEMRLWPWQSWQYGVQGILIWSTNYWTSGTAFPKSLQDPWQDAMSYVSGYGTPEGARQFWGNCDGRYLYPPRRDPNTAAEPAICGPISSLRWENLRDGVEDYEYFVLLKELIEKAKGKADAALLKEAEALLVVPEGISKNTTVFTTDVRPVLEQREKTARMIERLLKAAVVK